MKRREFIRNAAGLLVPAAHAAPIGILGGPGRVYVSAPSGDAPANSVAPAVTGTPTVGNTLSCTTGTWTNSPTSYAYQWLRDGSSISGATSSSYALQEADEGEMVSCLVTATNAHGSASQESNAVGPVEAAGDGPDFAFEPGYSGSGMFSDGESFTIVKSGGGFGSKPNDAKPLLWMPLSDSDTPSALGRIQSARTLEGLSFSATGGADGNGCLASPLTDGVGSDVFTLRVDSDESGASGNDWNGYGQKIFIHRKTKKTFGHYTASSGRNVKNFRMWGKDPSGGGIRLPDVYFATSNGRIGLEGLPNAPYLDYTMGSEVAEQADGIADEWFEEEWLVRTNSEATSTGSAPDADLRWAVNGGDYVLGPWPEVTWDTWHLRFRNASGDSNDGRMRILFPVHYVVEGGDGWTPLPAGNQFWADDVYVDDSWCRVVIGDSATYSSCTKREPQPPSAWADGSITITVNKGAFDSLSGKHLFVVDNDDNVFYVGSSS